MAETPVTMQAETNLALRNIQRVAWLAVPNGNTGAPVYLSNYQDRCVQVTGMLGVAGSVTIQGSNDGGTTWATLTDPLGNALTFTTSLTGTAGMKQITELPYQIRPSVTAGDGTTALNIYIHCRGGER